MKNPGCVFYTVTHSEEDEEEPTGFRGFLCRFKKDIPATVLISIGLMIASLLIVTQLFCSMPCAGCHRNTLLRKGKTIAGRSTKAWFCDDCTDRMIRYMLKEKEE